MKRIIRPLCSLALVACLGAGSAQGAEVLTLEDAWQRVLAQHPAVAAAEADLAARAADLDQAGRGLNPELGFEVENFAGSGEFRSFDSADLTLMLAQTWQRGGKVASRQRVAGAGLEASRTAAEVTRLQLNTKLVHAFVKVVSSQRRLALADTLAHMADLDRQAVDRRVAAGAENRVEAQLTRLSWSRARRERDRSRQELNAARLALGALWGDDQASFPTVSGNLDELVPVPSWQEVIDLVDASPVVRLTAAELARARAGIDVARAEGAVDLTTALGLRHFRGPGDNAVVLAVGVPLAVRDRNRDAQRAAAADVARVEAGVRAVAVDLKTDLADAWSRLATSQSDVLAIRRDMLPAAVSAMEEALSAHERGRYSLTEVFIVRRAWMEWNFELVDALERHHLAAADLTALLGIPFNITEITP